MTQTGYITYSSVCYGRTVLAEGFQKHGPFTIIARKLLDKINEEGRKQKRTFEIKEFLFSKLQKFTKFIQRLFFQKKEMKDINIIF